MNPLSPARTRGTAPTLKAERPELPLPETPARLEVPRLQPAATAGWSERPFWNHGRAVRRCWAVLSASAPAMLEVLDALAMAKLLRPAGARIPVGAPGARARRSRCRRPPQWRQAAPTSPTRTAATMGVQVQSPESCARGRRASPDSERSRQRAARQPRARSRGVRHPPTPPVSRRPDSRPGSRRRSQIGFHACGAARDQPTGRGLFLRSREPP
jgi:hypothetical protein